jgi:uncharacterized DUF497 family protein
MKNRRFSAPNKEQGLSFYYDIPVTCNPSLFVIQCLTNIPVKDIIIDILIIEEDREAHIAKHDVSIDEVLEVLTGDYVFIAGREERWLLIGMTDEKRYVTVVVGERPQPRTFGLVTARPSRRKERGFYSEFVIQKRGEEE